MRKLLYALCLLAFAACNDDDDEKVITDFDKPYGNHTPAELIELINGNIHSCEELYKEINEHMRETDTNLQDVIDHYGLEMPIYSLARSAAPETSATTGFTGVRLTWNRQKQDFDTTIDANGFMTALLPSSVTDDSRNDLEFVFAVDHSPGLYVSQKTFKDGQLLCALTRQETNSGKTTGMTGEYPPYYMHIEHTISSSDIVSRARYTINEINYSKEGGSSYLFRLDSTENDANITMEYNNVRLRSKFLQFNNIVSLLNNVLGQDDERTLDMCDELFQANMRQNVVVFTDRDEKIGEWRMIIRRSGDKSDNWICTFKDGTEHKFPFLLPNSRFD